MPSGPIPQEVLLLKIRILLEREGRLYHKKTRVFARPAQAGERVDTLTSDGLETTNTAQAGDMLVRNQTQAGEHYLMPAESFAKRYRHLQALNDEWAEYQAIGRIWAIQLTPERLGALELPPVFEFIAAWGSPMIARQGDFLAAPEDASEVYRIAQEEFGETYAPVG